MPDPDARLHPVLEYVVDPFAARRRPTREVMVGDVGIGGANPIRVQSMTTTDTMDTAGTVAQTEALADVGCEIVRITAPSIRDAENLAEITAELRRRKVGVPLVADIHFTPNAAMIAAEHVEKIRVNPGNYADKKKFEVVEYSDQAYRDELDRVADRFRPLVVRCKELGRAMRIGTNHGSLSDRIMNRYGDSPLGMVESALEFLDVCEAESYRDVVFSMKASNAQVAIQAYRLLAARLAERARKAGERESYPFHVGVTEAGDGEDGRIKSAIGIGSLLEDGIGDTVRVSLTEASVKEIPVARALVGLAEAGRAADAERGSLEIAPSYTPDPYAHARRASELARFGELEVGGDAPVRVELELSVDGDPEAEAARHATSLAQLGDIACESLLVRAAGAASGPASLAWSNDFDAALRSLGVERPIGLRLLGEQLDQLEEIGEGREGALARIVVDVRAQDDAARLRAAAATARASGISLEWCLHSEAPGIPTLLAKVLTAESNPCAISVDAERPTHAVRALVSALGAESRVPVVLRHRLADGVGDPPREDDVEATLAASITLGASLCDGIGDVVSLSGGRDPARSVDLAYRILQGARLRTTRTEYISCPSCGRTLFDLEETTARVKAATGHLRGVKIAVMGCIVNGPGEMADADFGYVGSGVGQVNLYVGHDVVARAVPEQEAPERLVALIQQHGRWDDQH